MDPVLSTGGLTILLRNFLKKVKLCLSPQDKDKKELGRVGENTAARFLIRRGYSILERNWRVRGGEVDIIVAKDSTLVFVEVKSRTSTEYGTGEEAITYTKRKRLIKAAKVYLRYRGKEYNCRFDVISILFDERGKVKEINHIQNAFIL
jgi:putative endonuclease